MSKAAELAALIGSQTALSNRNLIINGAMTIDQRNSGSSVTPTADQTYVLDRFGAGLSVASKFSLEQTTTVPAGFENSMKATVVSAYTPGSAEWFGFFQKVEGLNASHLDFGTSDAKTLTLSFWVRSSITGDYGFSLANSAQNRAYPVLYNISAADTWEHKTITIAGDTSGTWLTTNGIGLILLWSLGAGSSYLQTANAWGTGLGLGTTGQTNWITNASATFYITGVQLEVGEQATPFEHEDYGTTLRKCQRYYYSHADGSTQSIGFGANYSSSLLTCQVHFPVTMRSSPTLVQGSGTDYYRFRRSNGSDLFNSFTATQSPSTNSVALDCNANISGTQGDGGRVQAENASAYIHFDSEL
jgi:hypothetical protein